MVREWHGMEWDCHEITDIRAVPEQKFNNPRTVYQTQSTVQRLVRSAARLTAFTVRNLIMPQQTHKEEERNRREERGGIIVLTS